MYSKQLINETILSQLVYQVHTNCIQHLFTNKYTTLSGDSEAIPDITDDVSRRRGQKEERFEAGATLGDAGAAERRAEAEHSGQEQPRRSTGRGQRGHGEVFEKRERGADRRRQRGASPPAQVRRSAQTSDGRGDR